SDGDASPDSVVQWYKRHGYHFLSLTDHDKLTKPKRRKSDRQKDFVLLHGVELSSSSRKIPIHVNALCGHSAAAGVESDKSPSEVLAETIEISRKDGAITLVNHPNFGWALSGPDLLANDGFELLEIASGHPEAHDGGDAAHPSAEELWDQYMGKKHRIFSVAV